MSDELAPAGISIIVAKKVIDLLTPLGEEIVDVARAQMVPWKIRNLLKALERAEQVLLARGIPLEDAQPILREIAPWLEGVSVEDDPTMQELWAGLLAASLDPTTEPFPVDFVAILEQLTPLQASLLQTVRALEDPEHRHGPTPTDLAEAVDVESDALTFRAALVGLDAMRLVNGDLDEVAGPGPESLLTEASVDGIFLSPIGQALLQGCDPVDEAATVDEP